MFDDLNKALKAYESKWQGLKAGAKDWAFFEQLTPTAVAWKTADRVEYDQLFAKWHDACDFIFETWMNDRYVAKMHLRDTKLSGGITIIKLMQRRPGSKDAIGLDHVDFYSAEPVNTDALRAKEPTLKWTDEVNGVCRWTSLWFAGTEAKLRNDTVMNVVAQEMVALEARLIANS